MNIYNESLSKNKANYESNKSSRHLSTLTYCIAEYIKTSEVDIDNIPAPQY